MIELKELTKQFKEIKAVDSLSFNVKKGEILGLLGENGAGKTTTLRLLATMLKPTSGTAIIDGCDLVKDSNLVRSKIGILFGGETGLYDRLTAYENIAYFGELNGMNKTEIKNRIDKLAKLLDMEEYINRRVGKFSKGMKQKVAIARSIVHNPEIMFLDEPTSGLDVSAVKVVHDFIIELKKEGKTIVFSSHSMKEVEKLCERVAIIHKGKLQVQDSLINLKEKYPENDLEEIFLKKVGGNNE
jgi:sodium transport system ATP-binding protein